MTWAQRKRDNWLSKYFPRNTKDDLDVADLKGIINGQIALKNDYAGRILLELLQNIDDAANKAALDGVQRTEWAAEFILNDDSLQILNHGIAFNETAMTYISTGHISTKEYDNNTTGAKGVGFRGVLNWSDDIRIYSGDFAIRFSTDGLKTILKQLENENNYVYISMKEKEPGKLELISPLSLPFDIEPNNIPHQWHNKKFNDTYDTCIELRLNKNRIQDIKNAFETFRNSEFYSMLFMRRINKIIFVDNTDNMSRTTVLSVSQNANTKDININNIVHEKFYVFQNTATDTIAIPYNWDPNKTYPLYNVFPVNKEILPLPVIMNSTRFKLSQNRDSFVANTSDNQTALADLLIQLLNISTQQFTKNPVNKNWAIELFTLKPVLADNLQIWDAAIEQADLIAKLRAAKIIPTIDGHKLLSCDDNPEFFDITESNLTHLKDVIASEYINLQTANAIKTSILRLQLQEMSEQDLCNIINSQSDKWNVQQRIDVFKFWMDNYENFDRLPRLLKTQQDKFFELSKDNHLIVFSGNTIHNIPKWAEAQMDLINKDDRDYLFKITPVYDTSEKNKERDVANYYKNGPTNGIFEHTEKNKLITQINRFVRDNYKYAIDFLMYTYNEYKNKGEDLRADFGDLYLPGADGNIYKANQLYFGNSYCTTDDIGPKICCAAGYHEIVTPDQIGLSDDLIDDFVHVVSSIFKVHTEPKLETKEIKSAENDYCDILLNGLYNSGLPTDKKYIIEQVTLQTIDKLEDILLSDKINQATLLQWLSRILPLVQKNGSVSSINYRWGNANTRTQNGLDVQNYIIYKILNTKWLKINEKKVAPINCVLHNDFWPDFVPQTPDDGDFWKNLDIKTNVAELAASDFYDILLKIPYLNNGGEISTRIYNFIAIKTNYEKIKHLSECNNNVQKTAFLNTGKLWARQKRLRTEKFFNRADVRFHSGTPINTENLPILATPTKQGNADIFRKIFGIVPLEEKQTYNIDKLHHDSIKFEENFKIFKKYFCCFGTKDLHDVAHKIFVQIAQNVSDTQTGKTLSVDNYTVVTGKEAHKYLIYLDDTINADDKLIADALTDILSREATANISPSFIRSLWCEPDSERPNILLSEGYDIENLKDITDTKQMFINRVTELNKNNIDCTESIESIDFDTFTNLKNGKHIKNVLTNLNVDINDFNTVNLQINLRPYNKSLLTIYTNDVKKHFFSLKYNEFLGTDEETQAKFYKEVVDSFIDIENISDNEIKNTINFNAANWLQRYFHLSDEFMTDLNAATVQKTDIDELYNKQKTEFKKQLTNPNDDIVEELLETMPNQSLLLFGRFDSLAEQYKNRATEMYAKQSSGNITPVKTQLICVKSENLRPVNLTAQTANTSGRTRNHGGNYNGHTEQIKQQNGKKAEKNVYDFLCAKYTKENVSWISSNAKSYNAQSIQAAAYGGDAAGYDMFFTNDTGTQYIEVKSTTQTNSGNELSFIISANEEATAKKYKDNYSIYLVNDTKLIILNGDKLTECLTNGCTKDKICAVQITEAEISLGK